MAGLTMLCTCLKFISQIYVVEIHHQKEIIDHDITCMILFHLIEWDSDNYFPVHI